MTNSLIGGGNGKSASAPGTRAEPTLPQFPRAPAVPHYVPERPRLVNLIENGVACSAMVLVIAAEGAGKSTAAAQWGRKHLRAPVIWVDAEDSGGNGWDFYTDLVDDLSSAGLLGECEQELGGADAPRPLHRMATLLSRQMHSHSTGAAVVVERAELLSREALDLVKKLAQRGTLRFVLLARWLDDDFVFEAQVELQAVMIGNSDLELTEAEIRHSLETAGVRIADPEALSGVSLPLMLQSMVYRARQQMDPVITAAAAKDLKQQLSARSLRRLLAEDAPVQDRDNLLRLAIPSALDTQLAADLLGTDRSHAQRVLNRLRDAGHGEFNENEDFYLNPALAGGLREVALECLEPYELEEAYGVVSDWYEQREDIRQALIFADRAGSWERIDRLSLLHFDELQQSAAQELERILERASPELIRQRPYLGWFRMALLYRRPGGAPYSTLKAVGESVVAMLDSDARGLSGLINRAVLFAYYRTIGDFPRADEVISELLPALAQLNAPDKLAQIPQEQMFLIQGGKNWALKALRQYAASTKLFQGDYTAALGLIDNAAQPLQDESGKFDWRNLYIAGIKALTHASSGNITASRKVLSWIHSYDLPPAWDESYMGAPACIASAYVSLADGRPQTAAAELERVKLYQFRTEHWAFILDIRARIALYHKEPGMVSYVAAELRAPDNRPPTSPFMQIQLLTRAAAVAFTAGALPTAERYLDEARDLDYPGRPGVSIERVSAVLALYQRDWLTAREVAREILERKSLTFREEISMRLCWVQAELELVNQGFIDADMLIVEREFLAALALVDECGSPYDVLAIPPDVLRRLVRLYAPHRVDILAAAEEKNGPPEGEGTPILPLTEAELRVAQELAHSRSRAVIARRLAVSENTVKTHLRRIYHKLGVSSRAEAIERAYACGVLSQE